MHLKEKLLAKEKKVESRKSEETLGKQVIEEKKNKTNALKHSIRFHRILFALGCLMILLAIFFVLFFGMKNRHQKPVGDGEAKTVLEKLHQQALVYAKEIYPEDGNWLTDEQPEFKGYLSLEDLKNQFQKDIQMFNTEEVVCDTQNTYILFTANKDGTDYHIHLACALKEEPQDEEVNHDE